MTTPTPSARGFFASAYDRFLHLSARLDSPLLLVLRIFWGWQFLQTGWGKLHNIGHVVDFFTSLNIPIPRVNAPLVALMEFVGGILMIVGLGTRLVGLVLAFDMLVAYIASDREALSSLFSNDPSKFYMADPFTFLVVSIILLVFGAGIVSFDYLIARRARRV